MGHPPPLGPLIPPTWLVCGGRLVVATLTQSSTVGRVVGVEPELLEVFA
jgi:hypothetical protein